MVPMSDPVRTIAERVRGRVLREGVDLARDEALAARYATEEVRRYSERRSPARTPRSATSPARAREVVASITGYGPLQPFFDDPTVEEIWINGPTRVFVAAPACAELTTVVLSDREVRELVERMLQHSGRRVDLSSPFVDASLPDGSRLHVAIPDVTRAHWAVNVRKFQQRIRSLQSARRARLHHPAAAEFLRMSVLAGANILVSGATHTGKTTMLNALMSSPRHDRVVTVEETFELDLDVPRPRLDAVPAAEPRGLGRDHPPTTHQGGAPHAARPADRRRGPGGREPRPAHRAELGLPGMCTIHANSARDALAKLCTLPLLAGRNIDSAFVVPTVASCIDLVVHLTIDREGRRRVAEISAPTGWHRRGCRAADLIFWLDGGELVATGVHPARREKFEAAGLDPAIVLGAAA